MVTLRIADCRCLTGRFPALLPLVDEARRARAQSLGDTPAGRQCLAAGLLLCRTFGQDRCRAIRIAPQGKPYIDGERDFSLSHAGDYAALAVGNGAVGVDVERRRERSMMGVAKRFFHPEEWAFVQSAPDPEEAFLAVWTLKESYLKAEGSGFYREPSSFCILPRDAFGAELIGERGYGFRRYAAPVGYALSACARGDALPAEAEWVSL